MESRGGGGGEGGKIFKYSVNGLNRVLAYPACEEVWTKDLTNKMFGYF